MPSKLKGRPDQRPCYGARIKGEVGAVSKYFPRKIIIVREIRVSGAFEPKALIVTIGGNNAIRRGNVNDCGLRRSDATQKYDGDRSEGFDCS